MYKLIIGHMFSVQITREVIPVKDDFINIWQNISVAVSTQHSVDTTLKTTYRGNNNIHNNSRIFPVWIKLQN